MMLKKWIPVLILALSTSAYAATRDESLNKLYQLQGWSAAYTHQKDLLRGEYQKQLTAAMAQIEKTYVLTAEDKKKIEEINTQYLDAVAKADTPDAAQAFWKQNYAPLFTDAELEAMVKESETPLDRKAVAAALAVSAKMDSRYLDLNAPIRDQAGLDYYKALNGVLEHCACKSTGSSRAKTVADEQEAADSLVVSDLVERKVGKRVYFTGTIKNTGTKPIHAQVQLDLFKKGTFVDQYSAYIQGTLLPNGTRNFKVDCDCSTATMTPYDSFKAVASSLY